jgi:hypothetical protein
MTRGRSARSLVSIVIPHTRVSQRPGIRALSLVTVPPLLYETTTMSEANTHIEVEPSGPQPDVEHNALPRILEEPPAQQKLRAWITTYEVYTCSVRYTELNLATSEVHSLIASRTSEDYSLHEALEELNLSQRGYVLDHVSQHSAALVFVDIWKKERFITVFGKIELALLVWVTSGGLPDTVLLLLLLLLFPVRLLVALLPRRCIASWKTISPTQKWEKKQPTKRLNRHQSGCSMPRDANLFFLSSWSKHGR